MIVVIFEMTMKEGKGDAYFDLAEQLRSELESVDGFLAVERFRSLRNANKYCIDLALARRRVGPGLESAGRPSARAGHRET